MHWRSTCSCQSACSCYPVVPASLMGDGTRAGVGTMVTMRELRDAAIDGDNEMLLKLLNRGHDLDAELDMEDGLFEDDPEDLASSEQATVARTVSRAGPIVSSQSWTLGSAAAVFASISATAAAIAPDDLRATAKAIRHPKTCVDLAGPDCCLFAEKSNSQKFL